MSQHKVTEVIKKSDITKAGIYKIKGKNKIVTYTGTNTHVQQSDKDLANLNKILEPAMKKGALRHAVKFAGQYDDIPFKTFQEAQIVIAEAKTMYEQLPMDIRKEFNTPGKFLEFVQNPTNADRLEKMGILKGNDGLTKKGIKSGAPTETDKDGDGVPDPTPV